MVERINRDRISDITCNLLKPELIDYTQSVCHSLGIQMHPAQVRHSTFNSMRRRWMDSSHPLPIDPASERPIILVPKCFLQELPTLTADNWYDDLDTSLRDDLNLEVSSKVRKSEIIAIARENPAALQDWISMKEQTRPQPTMSTTIQKWS
jgi:hypothetical protein